MAMSELKKLRLLSEMTQHQLCKKLGISQGYLSLLENEQVQPNEQVKEKIKEIFK